MCLSTFLWLLPLLVLKNILTGAATPVVLLTPHEKMDRLQHLKATLRAVNKTGHDRLFFSKIHCTKWRLVKATLRATNRTGDDRLILKIFSQKMEICKDHLA